MAKKIAVIGLEAAGKTSLIQLLQKQMDLHSIKPTKMIDRSVIQFLANKINVWDFGGQIKYRKSYVKKAASFFSGIDTLYYIIDIQSPDCFDDSLSYYQDVLEAIRELSPEAEIKILFNKSDPDYANAKELVERTNLVFGKIKLLSGRMRLSYENTSIFNPIGVIHAFSRALFGNDTLYDNISYTFIEFAQTHGFDGIAFMSNDRLELGGFYSPELDQTVLADATAQVLAAIDQNFPEPERIVTSPVLTTCIQKVTVASTDYFLVLMYSPAKVPDFDVLRPHILELAEDVKTLVSYM
jgi:GTPase SAR1 family protein